MVDILVPVGRTLVIPSPDGHRMQHVIPNAAFFKDVSDIGHVFGGRKALPNQPIIVEGADGQTPTIIMPLGLCEAAEVEDLARHAQEKSRARMKKLGTPLPFDEFRERTGRPRKEAVEDMFRDALLRRMEQHRRNPISDPARQPQRSKKQWTVPEKTWDNKER